MKYNSPEWWIIIIGCISSIITGAGIPVYSVVFGNVVGVSINIQRHHYFIFI